MTNKPSRLIGKKVWIRDDVDTPYAGQRGLILFFFSGAYEVEIRGSDERVELRRNEFKLDKS